MVLVVVAAAACDDDSSPASPESTPPAVVLLIGDGMGVGALDAARITFGELAMERLPLVGEVRTSNASGDVTDSGAAATAYAIGMSTHNGAVGVDLNDVAHETVLEAAEGRGWATALVATSPITDATPAAFAAHVPNRGMMNQIAVDMADSGVDVLLGGGRQWFDPGSRGDGVDALAAFRQRGCEIRSAPDFASTGSPCLVGLLSDRGLPEAGRRAYTLGQMARLALEVVSGDPEGFFIMIEGSQIDWAASENDGPGLLDEMEDFDGAVREVLELVGDRPNTLIIVTADHETGGLSAERVGPGQARLIWTTPNHTAADVKLFGTGAGLEALPPELPNHELGRFLLRFVRESGEG